MTEINGLIESTVRQVSGLLGQMVWAEEEIEAARKAHLESDEALDGAFHLLEPTHPLMDTEFIYRAHVRELLDRVVSGEDTRPGTWAEIACLCHDVSLQVPLHGAAFGLYSRAWLTAFPDKSLGVFDSTHYEALYGSEIDDLVAETRNKLSRATRRVMKAV